MKVIILTQESCPKCESQKLFMMAALKNKYANNVEFIKKEDSPEEFARLVEETGTTQTPTTIFFKNSDKVAVINGFNPAELKKTFEKYLG